MTKEEAVYRLNALLTMCDFRDAFGDRVDSKLYEDAVAMAIEALEENESLAKSLNDAVELIHKLQKKNEWIACSERQPKEMGTYMTAIDYGKQGVAVGQRYYYGKNLGWTDDCVVAWMPLPPAWKGE